MAEWRDLETWLQAPVEAGRVIACDDADTRVLEPEFRRKIGAWQAALSASGARSVALHRDDPLEFAAALLAAWQLSLNVLLPADLNADSLRPLEGQIEAWIVDPPRPGRLQCGDSSGVPGARALDPEWSGLRLYTSGSSGTPQAIDKRLGQLSRELRALESEFGRDLGGAVVHATVSQQHIYGLLFRVLWPLCAGRPIARERLAFPEQIADRLARAPSLLVSTPAHLARLPELPQWPAAALQLRRVFSSGGPLPDAAAQQVQARLGQPALEVYGSSETGGIAWRRRPPLDAAWTPLAGVEWRIEDGLLSLRSPFLPDPRVWFVSSDRAEVGERGFRLLGRSDRIAKIEERRVSLTAVERCLVQAPGVAAAHVVLLPGRRTVIGAVLQLDPESVLPQTPGQRRRWIDKLRACLVDSLDPVCWPRQWRFLHTLPVDVRGKLSEAALRRLFVCDRPSPEWSHRDADSATLHCRLDPELPAFAGHFPQAPVLPGVALLDWIARWSGEIFALTGDFAGLEQLKFQQLARPGMQLNIQLQRQIDGARVEFKVSSAAGQHASGRLRFGPG